MSHWLAVMCCNRALHRASCRVVTRMPVMHRTMTSDKTDKTNKELTESKTTTNSPSIVDDVEQFKELKKLNENAKQVKEAAEEAAYKRRRSFLDQLSFFGSRKNKSDDDKQEENKGPYKNYQEEEERDKKQIMFYEDYFDTHAKNKNKHDFMSAIDAFRILNPTKKLYIDFIYAALLKMKEYNAHTDLETYRKLMQIFPVGPVRSLTKWQVDNMHYPRQQNCALSIMEEMEQNGVMPDEEFAELTIEIFGDWTHAVKKVKRQLYWMPKFKHANPYPVPTTHKLDEMSDIELAYAALERMTTPIDVETKLWLSHTDELLSSSSNKDDPSEKADEKKEEEEHEKTWLLTAQSLTQRRLLLNHKREVPIYVDGPFVSWLRSKPVNYFLLRTDVYDETMRKLAELEAIDDDEVNKMPNMFDDPFKKTTSLRQVPDVSPYEMTDGNVYAICCSGTASKQSMISWTKLLEKTNESLKELLIVYRVKEKEKPSALVQTKSDSQHKANEQQSN